MADLSSSYRNPLGSEHLLIHEMKWRRHEAELGGYRSKVQGYTPYLLADFYCGTRRTDWQISLRPWVCVESVDPGSYGS